MKRKVFLFGGSGGRMLEALLFMAFAGITPEETLDLVLCDPDGDGMHGAVQLRQELADYQRIWASRTYIGTENPAFQTEINLCTLCWLVRSAAARARRASRVSPLSSKIASGRMTISAWPRC